MADVSQLLSQAQNLIQSNQVNPARALLRETIRQYPNSEQAWLLTACVTETVDQSLYCLQQAIKINPQSQMAQRLLQQTKEMGIRPTISQISNDFASENIPNPDSFRQFTPPQLVNRPAAVNEPSTAPRQPSTPVLPPSPPVAPERVYFRDNQVFVSNSRIVFNQTTIPVFQVISSSYETVQPILARIFGVLFLLASCLVSLYISMMLLGTNWAESLSSNGIGILFTLIPMLACFGIPLILGLVLLFVPKKKFRVSIETPAGRFPISTSKEQKYTDTIVGAVNKALAERGPYIPQPGYYQVAVPVTPTSQIAWAWIVFVFSFVIPITLALVIPIPAVAGIAGILLQFTALGLGINLSRNKNPTAKANGLAITIIWLVFQCITGIIGFLVAVNR